MRSKQQPRPSYRWLNITGANDECDDVIETTQQKDESSSRSASPSSTNSLEGAQKLSSKEEKKTNLEFPRCKSPPKLIDSQDDVEHNIPASFIQDPYVKCEMVSPRCQSRNSSNDGRCISEDSAISQRDLTSNHNIMSPITLSLSSSLSQAAALLPQHSIAMAAYLEVAAAAVHQNHMALSTPLSSAERNSLSFVGEEILDFSRKDTSDCSDSLESKSECAVTLNKIENSPLDLSVSNRKRNTSESSSPQPVPRKLPRLIDFKSAVIPWTSTITPQLPYFATAVVAASLSPKNDGSTEFKNKITNQPLETNKALEKMSELSRLGGNDIYRPTNNSSSSSGRHSAWQSHWLNKGADSAKDVLKCVWCKESFPSLAALTTHMKETKHCGVNVPPTTNMHISTTQSQSQPLNTTPSSCNNSNTSSSKQQNQNDFNLVIKESMPLPRKLVRGQDVWLGKGAEQTRQILKCMWCGQSFRTLAEMTTHMQHTQHYTNIISQEQIISWRSSDEKGSIASGSGNNSGGTNSVNVNTAAHISHVSAVLTCKVCDQAFSSLKELSNHMVKNSHYKEHIMRSITESGGRRRPTREKRKKSLPVRKLLELERAQQDYKNGDDDNSSCKTLRDLSVGRITCEKCNEKIDTTLFVEHIRQCVGGSAPNSSQKIKPIYMNTTIIPTSSISPIPLSTKESIKNEIISSPMSGHGSPPHSVGSDFPVLRNSPSIKKKSSPSVLNALELLIEKSFDTCPRQSNSNINQNQSTPPLGASILKRLGIDENVDYTKPLVDSQTMNLLRNYHQQQQQYSQFTKRERSGSESSSISERGSSRLDSVTPEKKINTPCGTPDKYLNEHSDDDSKNGENIKIKNEEKSDDEQDPDYIEDDVSKNLKYHRENSEEGQQKLMLPPSKQNENSEEADTIIKRRNSCVSSPPESPRPASSSVPLSPALSPASDHHSSASRSISSIKESKITSSSGSLGALSSMFDSLTGSNNQLLTDSSGKPKKNTAHPLAALQKLCDKTENTPNHRGNTLHNSTLLLATTNVSNPRLTSTAMLAHFGLPGAIESGEDTLTKCSYCDTIINSKIEYRHHLTKVHFINDEEQQQKQQPSQQQQQQQTLQQQQQQQQKQQQKQHSESHQTKVFNNSQPVSPQSPKITNNLLFSNFSGNCSTTTTSSQQSKSSPISSPSSISVQTSVDESPHSKFLKYTELAKQLSSKYV